MPISPYVTVTADNTAVLNTVKVSGEVMYANTIAYNQGKRLNYYVNQAGGYNENASKSNVYIVYMNGTVSKANRWSRKVVEPVAKW